MSGFDFRRIYDATELFLENKPHVDAAEQERKARKAERAARAASDDDSDKGAGSDPDYSPPGSPAPSSDDDSVGGGAGRERVTDAALVLKARELVDSLKASLEPAELVAGGHTVQTRALFRWATSDLATFFVHALVSRRAAPTNQEWPIRVKVGGKRSARVEIESRPAFGTKKFDGGSYDTPAHATIVKDMAFLCQFALAAYVGTWYLLRDPAARDEAAVAACFVKAFAQMQVPAHEADGFDAFVKLPLAVALGRASLADVAAAEVAALKKAIADAYPAALLAEDKARQRRWLKGRSPAAGEMAANALETGARDAILACTDEIVDDAGHVVRVALLPKPNPNWGPLLVLFAFYRYLCDRFPCAPQVYVSDRLAGLAVTVNAGRVWIGWGAGKEINVGIFASPDAAEIVKGELDDSPILRALVAGGTFMADEDDTGPVAQAAALGRAESDMRCIFSDGMVAGMASLRFEEGSEGHKAMMAAVKEGRPTPADLKTEHDYEWRSKGRLTPEKAAAKTAQANDLAASIPTLRECESPELDSVIARWQNTKI